MFANGSFLDNQKVPLFHSVDSIVFFVVGHPGRNEGNKNNLVIPTCSRRQCFDDNFIRSWGLNLKGKMDCVHHGYTLSIFSANSIVLHVCVCWQHGKMNKNTKHAFVVIATWLCHWFVEPWFENFVTLMLLNLCSPGSFSLERNKVSMIEFCCDEFFVIWLCHTLLLLHSFMIFNANNIVQLWMKWAQQDTTEENQKMHAWCNNHNCC